MEPKVVTVTFFSDDLYSNFWYVMARVEHEQMGRPGVYPVTAYELCMQGAVVTSRLLLLL